MSDIRSQLPALLNTASLSGRAERATGLFGFRLRSDGVATMAAPGKVADLQRNAKIAYEVVSDLDTRTARLHQFGKQAEDEGRNARLRYNQAAAEYNLAHNALGPAVGNYNRALAAARARPNDPGAQSRLHFATRAYEDARSRFDLARNAFALAESRLNSAVADVQAVTDAIRQLEAVVPGLLTAIGEKMGLRNVFVEESRKDAKGRYTDDRMSFSEQTGKLLKGWAKTMKEGAELEDTGALNPVTRKHFRNQRTVGGKNFVVGEEAIVVKNLGSIGLFRKLFQRMMEDIIATATKKHA